MSAPTSSRPLRLCDLCLQVDDHPRHVIGTSGVDAGAVTYSPEQHGKVLELAGTDRDKLQAALRDLTDTSTTMRHMDCCRDTGCPDGTCGQVTAGGENLKGNKLVQHLTGDTQ